MSKKKFNDKNCQVGCWVMLGKGCKGKTHIVDRTNNKSVCGMSIDEKYEFRWVSNELKTVECKLCKGVLNAQFTRKWKRY